jgi:aspartate-semialdehyde dehydrogenase
VGGINLATADPAAVILSPHPGAVALAHLLHPLRELSLRRATATLLQPVSVRGSKALDEVFGQTRAILTFAEKQPQDVFSTQMAFNILPTSETADALVDHVHAVLGEEFPVEVQVLQAGVFHSYGISLFVEFENDPGQKAVEEALEAHPLIDRAPDPEHLGPIDAAGRDEVILGSVEADPRRPGVYRLWAVMDNITCGGALNAVQILEAVGVPVTN